jgi:hypothetical protein
MSDATSCTGSGDNRLADLIRDLEHAHDREAVVRRFCAEHSDLADQARDYERMTRLLDEGRADGLRVPEKLGEFRIRWRIGGGGMGEVYLAEQETLHRVLPASMPESPWLTC